MSVKVAKYINLQSRYYEYGEDGYFIKPYIIRMMLFDELKLANVEDFLKGAEITITEEEVKEFLDEKFEEENPELKRRMEAPRTISSIMNLCKIPIQEIKSSAERFKDEMSAGRYHFEQYSLQYFKTYTFILREKCQTLLSVLNDIENSKSEELSEEAKQRILDLDFHINEEGNIYFKDAERLADAIIYNIKDLRKKLQAGNNPETYLTFKESRHNLMKDDVWESDIYPSRKIQIKDRIYAYKPEFIALSEAQQTQIQKEELKNFSKWMRMDFEEDDYETERGPVLQKAKEENKQ